MDNRIQQRFLDAEQYDGMMAKVFPGYEQILLVILAHLRTRLRPDARLLDVGCGTGTALSAYARHQPLWSFVGVDPAAPMLELARRRLSAMECEARATLVEGTVEVVTGAPFDAATVVLVEHLLPDNGAKSKLLEGIYRSLAPGGWMVLFGLHGDLSTEPAQRALEAWLEFVTLQGLPAGARDNVRQRATQEDALVSAERLAALIKQAGFVRCERFYQAMLLGGWIAQRPHG